MLRLGRIGLIGDVHAEDEALGFVLETLGGLGLDALLQVGDLADGAGDLDATCALLEGHRVLCVSGNHDRWLLGNELRDLPDAQQLPAVSRRSLGFIDDLPALRSFESARGRILLCHGLGENDMASVKPDDEEEQLERNAALQSLIWNAQYRIVLNGHTHRPMLRTFGRLTLINAGTIHRGFARCFSVVDFEAGELTRWETPIGPLERDVSKWSKHWQSFG